MDPSTDKQDLLEDNDRPRYHSSLFEFPANSYTGMKILGYLCDRTETTMGTLTMYFGSAHI